MMRFIFADHDRASQIKRIREGIEQHRSSGASDPDSLEMHPIYDEILKQVAHNYLEYWKEDIAVVALGGYGRKEMSPYSDIDLLFLRTENAPEGVYRGIRNILHLLWDSKVELGHSVRTTDECRTEANKDLAVLTSLLDIRFIWGNVGLFRQLAIERERLIEETDPLDLYLKIEAEIRKSSSEFEHTIYLLEPYVKDGPGSLRYIQLIAWLSRMIFGCNPEGLPILRVCGPSSVEEVLDARRFLAGVRTRLHYLAGRRDDRLGFGAQSTLAEQMGFADTPERPAVVNFMREYYRHSATAELFGQRVLARARLFLIPSSEAQVKRMKLDNSFHIGKSGINRFDETAESLSAPEMLQAFKLVAQTGSNLDIRLLDLIGNRLPTLGKRWVEDPDVNATFMEILRSKGHISKALMEMMNTGFLELFIPDFERVRYLRQHDAYHEYTVDRHTMMVLENVDSFGNSSDRHGDTLIRKVYGDLEKPELLYLAGLLHDIGKGRGPGHELRGVALAKPVLQRLGLSKQDMDDVCFIIRNHLAMSHLAFKKDFHDVRLLSRFAESLMHKRMLDMLLLLTHADLRAVGPRGFNSWRGLLLEELYYRTLDVIQGESAEGEDLGDWLQQIKAVIREKVPAEYKGAELESFLDGAPSRYLLDFYPGIIVDHFVWVRTYLRDHGKTALDADDLILSRVDHRRPGYSSITFITKDRRGLFFMISGALSANRINILSAWSHSMKPDMAIATFHVDDNHQPLSDPDQWEKFRRDFARVLAGEADVHELVAARRKASRSLPGKFAPRFPVRVEVDNAASDRATIIEVYAHDRPGLLYDITRAVSSLGLDIILTKITTEVDQAADIFYVVDAHGEKIVDFDRLEEIRDRLKEHLIQMEEAFFPDGRVAAF